MEQLLKDIQNRLTQQVTALKYVDEDWGQLDYYSQHPPVKFPCALIDVVQANWSNEGKKIQTGLVQVKIILSDMRLSNSSGAAPQNQKDKAFGIRITEREIFKALHGWSGGNNYSKLIRMSSAKVKKDGMQQYETIFTTQYTDASAMPQKDEMFVMPAIEVNLVSTGSTT